LPSQQFDLAGDAHAAVAGLVPGEKVRHASASTDSPDCILEMAQPEAHRVDARKVKERTSGKPMPDYPRPAPLPDEMITRIAEHFGANARLEERNNNGSEEAAKVYQTGTAVQDGVLDR
jgi:hypothetical protein